MNVCLPKHLPLFFICCFTASCATLFNTPYRRIEVQTSEPCRIEVTPNPKNETRNSKNAINADTLHWETVDNWVEIRVPRSRSPLLLRVIPADSFSREYRLPAKMSGAVWLDIAAIPAFGMGLYGVLIDRNKAKFFTYPGTVYVDLVNDQVRRADRRPPQQGTAYFGLGFPVTQTLQVAWPGQDFRSKEFNWGISMLYERYYRNGTALCLKGGFSVEQRIAKSAFVSLGQRHWFGPLQFGYGLGYTGFFRPKYPFDYPPPKEINQLIVRQGLGPMLGIGTRLGRHLVANIDFQSILLNMGTDAGFGFSNFWAFEVAWRFRAGGR